MGDRSGGLSRYAARPLSAISSADLCHGEWFWSARSARRGGAHHRRATGRLFAILYGRDAVCDAGGSTYRRLFRVVSDRQFRVELRLCSALRPRLCRLRDAAPRAEELFWLVRGVDQAKRTINLRAVR